MEILHVTATLDGASGVATFVRELNASLRAKGCDTTVITSSCVLPPAATASRYNSPTSPLSRVPWLDRNSPSDGGSQLPDILHIHGLWLKMYHQAAQWAMESGIPIVWSTHGMTAPWSMHHKWWKKLPAWWLYQKRDLKQAVAIHCTTEQEVEWNKSIGLSNCFIVPLGTHLPPLVGVSSLSSRKDETFHSPTPTHNSNSSPSTATASRYTLLFVGRIYPVKGLVNLIKAWKLVQSQDPNSQNSTIPFSNSNSKLQLNHNWKLRIVGPDQAGHQAELESLVRELNLVDSVEFPGPKFGRELELEYENCSALVLPSFTENFGATIVDALAHCKPCIASTFTPWRELQAQGCGWWVSNNPEPLAAAIKEMMTLDDAARRSVGEKGRRLVEDKYTWDAVADTMIAKYREVVSG